MPKTKTIGNAAPFLIEAEGDRANVAGFPEYCQELWSAGLDSALEFQKSSMAAAVCFHSCAIEIYKDASCLTPEIGAFVEMTAKSFALCAELQSYWLSMLTPWSKAASDLGIQAMATAEELAEHMDIACGHKYTAAVGVAAKASSSHTHRAVKRRESPAAEELESSMDTVIASEVA